MVLNQSPLSWWEAADRMGKKKKEVKVSTILASIKKDKAGTLPERKTRSSSSKTSEKPRKKIEKPKRGRKAYFSQEEIRILQRIVEKRRRLDQHLTRPIIARQFEKKTGRKITHVQRNLSDVRGKLGLSWQKLQPRSRRQAAISTQEKVKRFLKWEKRVARRRKWFVDQIKLPDAEVIGRGYGTPGKGTFLAVPSSTGSGTGIMSCNWAHGMGPFTYVRNSSSGTTAWGYDEILS